MSSNSGDGVFCPHCGETIAARTFRLHRSLFFSENSRAWSASAGSLSSDSDCDEDLENTRETVFCEQELEAVVCFLYFI